MIGPCRRTRRDSPAQVNDPVTIAAPTGSTPIEQQWRDAARAELDKHHPASINNDPTYVS